MAASPELSSSVERWRRRYLSREAYLLDVTQAKSKSRRALKVAGDNSPDDTIASILINSSQSKLYCRRKHNRRFLDSSKTLKKLAWPDDELDSLCDSDQLQIQPEPIGDFLGNGEIQSEGIYSEADITLPSTLGVTAYCDYNNDGDPVRDNVSFSETQELSGESMVTPQFNQIYHELLIINQKLQQEKLSQQEYALKLQKRERFITQREIQLCRHEAALIKIKGVEEEVHTKFQIMKEQHAAEIKQLSNVLKEKIKENKRLKTSFETLKELNDTLKKQLSDVTEQNKKLEVQSRKVQARLENLQLPLNPHVYNLLTVLMDWISEQHLCKLIVDEDKENIPKLTGTLVSSRNCIKEKCVKLLPLVVEQLQWLPFVNPNLHFPVVKCIYWAVRQLNGNTQHTAMTSTMRRLGEDLFKGVVPKESQHNSSEHATDSKPKAASFFKSCNLSLRVVSTLIIIKVVTQADYLAQAFDSLCIDLKTEEGKVLFLDYQAVPIILTHLRISRKGILSNAIDSLLQMTTESRYLNRFLETCSNELFFRTCSVLLRSSNLDIQLLEKLSILLQKLSKIKSNKKMFELFTLHLMIQELLRTAHPDHTFLCINLNSILFNLGLIKNNPIESNENASD
ncbi:coiled-coil domain-containing protein 138 isoform X2 [Ahaetulla prasina]|uniref:coiled-coil domain-containing protein 138 isoform X2 n=1 Tax=Ahaetulla prasina TaxID=499056 RepID=UPI0026477D9C|nr:coiled-coil domain-containing protein 138 isoform X2 [Ahaetulla prasina]